MQVYDSLSEPGGEHPAGPAAVGHQGARQLHGARQGGVPQPGRLGQGPHRAADDSGRRGVGRAQARRHDRGAHLGQHRRRAGDCRGRARLPVRLRLPRQGGPGQDQRAARVRRRGRGLPGHGGARSSRLLLQRRAPAGGRDTRRLAARPVREPGEPGLALRLAPARRSGSRPTGPSPTSWRGSAPAERSPAPAGT